MDICLQGAETQSVFVYFYIPICHEFPMWDTYIPLYRIVYVHWARHHAVKQWRIPFDSPAAQLTAITMLTTLNDTSRIEYFPSIHAYTRPHMYVWLCDI